MEKEDRKKEPVIIDHNHPIYRAICENMAESNRWNGAYYYSKEIVKNIIPNVQTDRSWVTINIEGVAADHAIVFIHNNLHPERYDWLRKYKDLILVCGIPETVPKVQHLGKAIYLPLSVDVEYVSRFRMQENERDLSTAFVGRPAKRKGVKFPVGVILLERMKRPDLLRRMARCHNVYAVGRTAIEARILGCNILPYDPRFPDVDRWTVIDNKEAAKILQKLLDDIDGVTKNDKGRVETKDKG